MTIKWNPWGIIYSTDLIDVSSNVAGGHLELVGVVEHHMDMVDGGGVHPGLGKQAVRLLRVRDHGASLLGLNVVNACWNSDKWL